MIEESDFENIREPMKRLLTPFIVGMWIAWGVGSVFFFPVFPLILPLWVLMVRSLQLVVFYSDRVVSLEKGYYETQAFLHNNLKKDGKTRSKLVLFFYSLVGTQPFFQCRVGMLHRWKKKQEKKQL
jgi:hypothetical protein